MRSDPNEHLSVSAKARSRRVRLFASYIEKLHAAGKIEGRLKIVDVGGKIQFWQMNACYMPQELIDRIEVVNLPPFETESQVIDGIRFESYAGNALEPASLRSTNYDIVHSNSVIEHVGNLSAQKVFSDNICALAPYHFIQTPCLTFPLEPHFYFPFFALLPLSVRTFLHCHFSLGFMGRERAWLKARMRCEETRLLSRKELRHLFCDSECVPERMFWMTKSWIVTDMANKTSSNP